MRRSSSWLSLTQYQKYYIFSENMGDTNTLCLSFNRIKHTRPYGFNCGWGQCAKTGCARASTSQSQGTWKCKTLFAIITICCLKWWLWNSEKTEITSNIWWFFTTLMIYYLFSSYSKIYFVRALGYSPSPWPVWSCKSSHRIGQVTSRLRFWEIHFKDL